ncbi:hypothetical protein E2C01_047698 [Portunus trituberculatus]|uniref:Uncharacterized protein n=1 Tax=Portunus trituberculatus TaxID=210409 RepID=A0A5B7G9J3_PORTR|nr:hypothetical protein [Portunus trituberculatus]
MGGILRYPCHVTGKKRGVEAKVIRDTGVDVHWSTASFRHICGLGCVRVVVVVVVVVGQVNVRRPRFSQGRRHKPPE